VPLGATENEFQACPSQLYIVCAYLKYFLCLLWLLFHLFGLVVFQSQVRQDEYSQITHTSADDTLDDEMDDKLPAWLEFRESGEDAFFAAVSSEVNGERVHFKLAPTYTLYMCCRYRTSPAYRKELSKLQRGERLAITVQKIANMVRSTVEVCILFFFRLLTNILDYFIKMMF